MITFVEPGRLTAVPAVVTTRSPASTAPAFSADSSERVQRSSTFSVCGSSTGMIPHSSAICCSAVWWCESPTIGRRGRSRATADAVRPVKVGTRIALAPSVSARSHAAFDIALPTVGSSPGPGSSWR